MKNVVLKRIYLDNFKLFNRETLTFVRGLNVFDGPNGYGKTSVFDAIEFIITGTIKRISESSAINGTLKYQHIFLANDSKKDVIIKAEFIATEVGKTPQTFVVAKKISGVTSNRSSAERNPKKLAEITKTYLLPSFDTEELREDYVIPLDKLAEKQIELFGSTSQNMYTMLYYVQQEDRLDFFKNNEKDRVRSINVLFQIEQEKNKLYALDQAKKKLNNVIKELDTRIQVLSNELADWTNNASANSIEYFQLLARKISWDSTDIRFKDERALQETIESVLGIKALVQNLKLYEEDLQNRKCMQFLSIPSEVQHRRLLAFLFYSSVGNRQNEYLERQKTFEFLNKQYALWEQEKITEINYTRLAQLLEIQIDLNQIQELLNSYQHNQEISKTSQQTLTTVLQIRQQLLKKSEDLFGEQASSVCQYCGFDWKDSKILSEQIAITTKNLESMADGSTQQCIQIIGQLKDIFITQYKVPLENERKIFTSDFLFMEFNRLHNPNFLQEATDTQHLLLTLHIEHSYVFSNVSQDNDEAISALQEALKGSISLLPPEYESEKQRFNFDQVLESYFSSLDEVKKLNPEIIERKIEYLRYSFQVSQQETFKKLEVLQEKRDQLKTTIAPRLDDYSKKWKQSISKYQSQIISKIEIPFYIYSARILQSYQGGQGILIKQSTSASVGEVDSIRFTSPGQEHDVLYIMSSGQLSGVLLSFSLALYKIFAGDGLTAIFIDDPVQCMDDLNIVSFVELLRSEFEKSQLLISTHEKGFANYISYKYKKHNLEYQRINLKEI